MAQLEILLKAGRAISEAKKFTGAVTKMSRATIGLLNPLRGVNATLLKLGGAFGAFRVIQSATRDVMAFQTSMANVSTMLTDQTTKFLPEYKRQISDLSVVMGENTNTLAGGLFDVLSASISASEAMGVLEVSSKGAAAGMTDTKTAADAITTVINSYGLAASDAERVSSDLFEAVQRGKITFTQLATSIGLVSSTAAAANINQEELLGSLSTMTRAGVPLTVSITSLNSILKGFASSSKEARSAAREFGIELDSQFLQAEQLTGIIQRLSEGGASPEDLIKIFPNIEAMKGLNALMQQTTGFIGDVKFITESTTGAQDAFNKVFNRSERQFNTFRQAVTKAKVVFAEEFTNAIGDFLEDKGLGLNEWLNDNQADVAAWSGKIGIEITTLIDKFGVFTKFLINDVSGAMGTTWEIFLKIMREGAAAAFEISIIAGKGIAKGLASGILGKSSLEESIQSEINKMQAAGTSGRFGNVSHRVSGAGQPSAAFIGQSSKFEAREAIRDRLIAERHADAFGDLSIILQKTKETLSGFLKDQSDANPEILAGLEEANEKRLEQLAALNETVEALRKKIQIEKEEAMASGGVADVNFIARRRSEFEKLNETFQKDIKKSGALIVTVFEIGSQAGDMFGNSLTDIAFKARNLNDILSIAKDSMRQLLEIALKTAIFQPAGKRLGGLVTTGLGAVFGGLGASGFQGTAASVSSGVAATGQIGPLRPDGSFGKGGIANTASIFGESGAEAAVPLPDGRSIPVTLKGGAGNVNIQIINQSGTKIEQEGNAFIEGGKIMIRLVASDIRQGGDTYKAFQDRMAISRR